MFRAPLEINAIRLDPAYVAVRAGQTPLAWHFSKRVASFGAGLLREVLFMPRQLVSLTRGGKAPFLCFTSTINQTSALEPIVDGIDGLAWIVVNHPHRAGRTLDFPGFAVSLVALVSLPATLVFALAFLLFRKEYGSFGTRARALAFSFDEVLRAYGYLAAAHLLIAVHRPHTIVVSNDHNAINRALCLAGEARGVRTIYVQHAPVTHVFPRLIVSEAFLDSEISADLYRRKPSATRIQVLGASRYDERFRPVRSPDARSGKVVSLCFNKIDDPARVLEYLEALAARGWKVVLRPHPAMGPGDLAFLPPEAELDRSPISEHLRRVRFLIAGSSGVLLDAFMGGVVPVLATDLSRVTDYYGFLERGAVYPLDLGRLDNFDEECESWNLAALAPAMKAFNAAIGTPAMYSVACEIRRRLLAEGARIADERVG